MAEPFGNASVVLIGQVTKAKSNHRVEKATRLLRNETFPGKTEVVYLGNIASAIIAALESPDTPEFTQLPGYNEQKWQLKTISGPLTVTITSDSYWGFGLLTSGYLNIIELTGPTSVIARLIFDLVASSGWQPWRFKHPSSAQRYLMKRRPDISLDANEQAWVKFVELCKQEISELIQVMENAIANVARKVAAIEILEGWSKSKAEVSVAAARYDLNIANEALADRNLPSVERAIARIEASLIEANPDNAMNEENSGLIIEKSLESIRFDDDLVVNPSDDELIPLVDLTDEE
tara:strand:+ start:1469 stop:2344 length:876 start_codon:yes stop_codon:yes gene_type:complete